MCFCHVPVLMHNIAAIDNYYHAIVTQAKWYMLL